MSIQEQSDRGESRISEISGFEVVAVKGNGVWVADEDTGDCWRLADAQYLEATDNLLADAYKEAIHDG